MNCQSLSISSINLLPIIAQFLSNRASFVSGDERYSLQRVVGCTRSKLTDSSEMIFERPYVRVVLSSPPLLCTFEIRQNLCGNLSVDIGVLRRARSIVAEPIRWCQHSFTFFNDVLPKSRVLFPILALYFYGDQLQRFFFDGLVVYRII
jgi:hypothetical protein